MNHIFKMMITILMILLILVLIWVLVNYYHEDPYMASPSETLNFHMGDNHDVIEQTHENALIDEETNNEVQNEPPAYGEEDVVSETLNEVISKPFEDESTSTKSDTPVVITSSENTSNKEKQEVLNEIDKALMDLLQVVDKVQPVDETRLGIQEGEVQ